MDKKMLTLMAIVFIDLMGLTIAIPIIPALLIDLQNGIMPLSQSIIGDLGLKNILHDRNITLGWLLAAYPIAQLFGSPFFGSLSDKYGRKKILQITVFGTFIGFVLFIIGIQTHSLLLLFISRIIDGFSGGNISIVFSAIADISKPEEKSRNFGFVGMAFGVGFILGPFIGGVLSDDHLISWFSYATPFYLSAFLSLVNIFAIFFFMPETNIRRDNKVKINLFSSLENVVKAFKFDELRNLFITYFFFAFGFNFFTQFFQVFLLHQFHFNQSEVGSTFGFIGLFIIFTQGFLNGKLNKKYKPSTIVLYNLFFLGLGFSILWMPKSAYLIFLILPVISIAQGLVSPNLMSIISDKASPEHQGEIMGINQSVQAFASILPPIISGYIININYFLPIQTSAVMVFISWIVYKRFYKK